jgi:hypothetical protein
MAAGEARNGIEINGVAHVILRVKRISECIAFYDQVMPEAARTSIASTSS